jgi:hypothetical protein
MKVTKKRRLRVGQATRTKLSKTEPQKIKVKKFPFLKGELKLYWYWINERHKIYVAREAGKKYPWTGDKILGTYKFTNPYRQNDRVTKEWTRRWVTLLGRGKKMTDGDIIFHCAMFRLFNWPETYDALHYGLNKDWDVNKAIDILSKRRDDDHEQIFTGAYIVSNGNSDAPKVEVICKALDYLYDGRNKKQIAAEKLPMRHMIARKLKRRPSMQRCVNLLASRIPTVGPFVGYEIACDLRHTRILADATDILSWANAGPGAMRGIHRLLYGQAKNPTGEKRPPYNECMRSLLAMAPDRLSKEHEKSEWPFEMREVEHSLCEYDKYSRVLKEEGRPRSLYRPPSGEQLDLFDDE